MLQVILWSLLAYFVYRFVFNFLIPVFSATRQFKRQVREFQTRMGREQEEPDQFRSSSRTEPKERDKGDYIEFEEVK